MHVRLTALKALRSVLGRLGYTGRALFRSGARLFNETFKTFSRTTTQYIIIKWVSRVLFLILSGLLIHLIVLSTWTVYLTEGTRIFFGTWLTRRLALIDLHR